VPVPVVVLFSRTLSLTTRAMIYPYANVTVSEPEAILKISPESIVFAVSNGVWNNKFPDVVASFKPIQPTVPHEAVACGNVQSALDDVTPLDGAANVIDVLAYEPPETSVPLPASVGSEVHSDT